MTNGGKPLGSRMGGNSRYLDTTRPDGGQGPNITVKRKKPKKKVEPVADLDKMYIRPMPNPFTPDYEAGYETGLAGEPVQTVNINWLTGFRDGVHDRDKKGMDTRGSSNA